MESQKGFVDTKLATKFGDFNIRVYEEKLGKETFVLWSQNLDFAQPPLVRVHSECITGDMLGSLHCDCGEQLTKSLQFIGKEGGVLIYLRQEGRGIGLFEKIKSYQLQSEGYDTFDANVLLGHLPDSRTYEMVKTVLSDLGISSIKLLTNNSSKVSDIAKLGINIVEYVPIISNPNKYNKKYIDTKNKKFKHLCDENSHYYFYQFQAELPEHVEEIIELIDKNNKDPLLKICVGITANSLLLKDDKYIGVINSIIQSCQDRPDFIPVLHYSFSSVDNILEEVMEIKKKLPDVCRLQINDINNLDVSVLKSVAELLIVDIPLSNKDFDIVNNAQFRNLVKKTKSFIILDNSKGRGVKESKTSLMKKIDILLAYGLNDIVLCGGFGPDELDTYFAIRRYYRFNFSIDAQTKLKTEGKIDINKVKFYLLQLIRFVDPKYLGVEQTKKFLAEHRHSDTEQVKIQGHEFLILPNVFHAGHFPSTAWFATELSGLLKNSHHFCEVGCGSGVISCLVALSNPKLQISATDINPDASENTKINAGQLGLSSRISVFTGDVLDNIEPCTGGFDSIFWALPFGFLDPGTTISLEEAQVFDPGYRAIRKLLKTAKKYLKPGKKLLLGFSSDLGHYELLQSLVQDVGASMRVIVQTKIQEDVELQFEILELSYGEI